MKNLYDRLSQCLTLVTQHNGSNIDTLYTLAYRLPIPETRDWRIKDLFMKLLNDGEIFLVDKHVFITHQEGSP